MRITTSGDHMLCMDHPDEDLSHLQLSLLQFMSIAQNLFRTDKNDHNYEFIRFVLAGRLGSNGTTLSRIFVNARQGANSPPPHACELRRDFDSLIGITRDLPFTSALAVFPNYILLGFTP